MMLSRQNVATNSGKGLLEDWPGRKRNDRDGGIDVITFLTR